MPRIPTSSEFKSSGVIVGYNTDAQINRKSSGSSDVAVRYCMDARLIRKSSGVAKTKFSSFLEVSS